MKEGEKDNYRFYKALKMARKITEKWPGRKFQTRDQEMHRP